MKGVVATPMPKRWYNKAVAAESDNPIDAAICADRKPYFMIYRYPELRSQYNTFQKNMEFRCRGATGASLKDTLSAERPTGRQCEFLAQYKNHIPVQKSNGVINRICHMCEDYFARYRVDCKDEKFDFSILRTGVDYSRYTKDQIVSLYHEYMSQLQHIIISANSDDDFKLQKQSLREDFLQKCYLVTPSAYELCDVVIDICYSKEKSKQFAWDMCGDIIIENLIRKRGGYVNWPKQTMRGDIAYGGKHFKMERLAVLEDMDEGHSFE